MVCFYFDMELIIGIRFGMCNWCVIGIDYYVIDPKCDCNIEF